MLHWLNPWHWIVPYALCVLGLGAVTFLVKWARPKPRDPRLDRTWAGKPGKYDNPSRRYYR